jgi:endonuclease III
LDVDEADRHESSGPVLDLVAQLEQFYGLLPVPPDDPFRCYVWEALSTLTTPGRRDAAYTALQRIPALTPDSMFRAARGKLTAAVALAGPYREQRLDSLLSGSVRFRREPRMSQLIRGPLRQACRAVGTLPRLGDASAHRLLLFSGDHCVMPVDHDTARLCQRLGVNLGAARPGNVRMVRKSLQRHLPPDAAAYRRAALYLRHHATQTCTEESHCSVCPIASSCVSRRFQ